MAIKKVMKRALDEIDGALRSLKKARRMTSDDTALVEAVRLLDDAESTLIKALRALPVKAPVVKGELPKQNLAAEVKPKKQ